MCSDGEITQQCTKIIIDFLLVAYNLRTGVSLLSVQNVGSWMLVWAQLLCFLLKSDFDIQEFLGIS